jgi:hypothetical protein
MAREFDAEIAQAEQEAGALKPQMAGALAAWLDVAAPWAAEFWEKAVAKAVKESPDAVKALGEEGRKSVKTEATQFIDNARVYIQRRLVDEHQDQWPHLKPQTDPRDEAFHKQGPTGAFHAMTYQGQPGEVLKSVPDLVAGPLNSILGDLAPIFVDHGFKLKDFKRDEYGQGPGAHYVVDTWDRPAWSYPMIDAMAAFGVLHDRYMEALERGSDVAAEKNRTEANDLWGKA